MGRINQLPDALLTAQTVRLQDRARFDRSASARMRIMQEDGEPRPHSLPMRAYGLLEQSALNAVRQTIPTSDNGLAQCERNLDRSLPSEWIHGASLS